MKKYQIIWLIGMVITTLGIIVRIMQGSYFEYFYWIGCTLQLVGMGWLLCDKFFKKRFENGS